MTNAKSLAQLCISAIACTNESISIELNCFLLVIAVAFFNNNITLNDLKNMAEESRAKLLGILLPFLAYEYGPQFVRDLWKRSDCKWEQFDSNVEQYLERYVRI